MAGKVCWVCGVRRVLHRAQRVVGVWVLLVGGGGGAFGTAAGSETVVVVVVAVARVGWKVSMVVVWVSDGFARVGFVRVREGGWMGGRGFRGGWVRFESRLVGGVVEVRLVMRRGRGMRWCSDVEVGWREGAERLWVMEGRTVMGCLVGR